MNVFKWVKITLFGLKVFIFYLYIYLFIIDIVHEVQKLSE